MSTCCWPTAAPAKRRTAGSCASWPRATAERLAPDVEHDLALRAAGLTAAVGLGGLGERQDLAHVDAPPVARHEPRDLLARGAVVLDEDAGGPAPAVLRLLDQRRVDAARHGDEQAALLHDLQRAPRVVAADQVDDEVDRLDGLLEADLPVVDGLVRADLAQEIVLARARRADDVRAARLRDLHGEVPDAARGGVDEDALALAAPGGVDKLLPGGEGGERQRGRLDRAEPLRD